MKQIYVVEDEKDIVELLRYNLEKEGYRVLSSLDGAEALKRIPEIREEFWSNVTVLGTGEEFNRSLERAGRVADYLEFGELMVQDALHRNESCGSHFREEYQTSEGEAKRDDENFCYVAAWQYNGDGQPAVLNKEPLAYESVPLAQRSYK